MKSMFKILLCYRRAHMKDDAIRERVVIAHSITHTKVVLRRDLLRVDPKQDYVILAGAKIEEV